MELVIAEKPSVAQSIAAVLGATQRKDGYLEGNEYLVHTARHTMGVESTRSRYSRKAMRKHGRNGAMRAFRSFRRNGSMK